MKGIYLIAFLALWTVVTADESTFESEDECPARDTCPPKLIFHKTDCTQYYECKKGQKALRKCAPGLHFSKNWRGCVRPAISECRNPNGKDECPARDTCPPKLISHETDCTQYYECKKGQKTLRKCAFGLHFSKNWRGCVRPAISECEPPNGTGGCTNGELIPHECVCQNFYECKHGQKALRQCPTGSHFSKTSLTCVRGLDCKEPINPICREGEYLPHECQCKKYYVCIKGRKALRECTSGWHFDETSSICVRGEDCGKKKLCEDGERTKHECDCNKYYICQNSEWIYQVCQEDRHFSPADQTCKRPIDAGCDENIKYPGKCLNSSPSKWAHECDCRLYYQCEDGKKKLHYCDWGSYFDNNNLICDSAENVKHCRNNWDDWI